METVLDSANWLLESAEFREDRECLCVKVVELINAEEPTDFELGGEIFKGSYAIEETSDSRRFAVGFRCIAAWQSIAEVLTVPDVDEVGDTTGVLRALTKSKYLDFLQANHGWFESLGHDGAFVHYELITEWQILHVVAAEAPVIESA